MKYALTFIFLLTVSSVFGQSYNTDSLASWLTKKTLSEIERIDVLNELAYRIRISDTTALYKFSSEALSLAEKNNYTRGLGYANINMGYYYLAKLAFDKSGDYGARAIIIFKEINNREDLMRAHQLVGALYRQSDNPIKAQEHLNQSFALARQLNDSLGVALVYNERGSTAFDNDDNSEALQLYMKALEHLPSENSPAKVEVMCNIGGLHRFNGDTQAAFEYLFKALEVAKSINDKPGQILVHYKLAHTYLGNNELEKAENHLRTGAKLAGVPGHMMKQLVWIYRWTRFETERKEKAILQLKHEKEIQTIWQIVLVVGVLLIIIASYFIYRLQRSRTEKTKQLLEVQQLFNDKLKEMDQIKSSFFANISHEFRTPLTLILAPLESELKKRSSAEGKESLLLIRRSANRLLELVNQLLDLSKLESGRMDLHVKKGDLRQLVSVIAASFDSLAEQRQITFVKKINIDEKPYWYDQDKLEKILTNVLANAFKYTPAKGTVTLAADIQTDLLSVTVTDTGKGIPEEEQAHIFSPFYQTRQTGQQQGTGLGLSLVKELVKLYNGAINLKSSVGAGTSFTITIPVSNEAFTPDQIILDDSDISLSHFSRTASTNAAHSNTELPETLELNKDSILIVEDNADMREFMSVTLQRNGYAVLTSGDGKDALPLALKYIPSLVLSDLMMMSMDGMELTKRIKEDERTSHIPVILLTAKNEQQSRIDSLKTGADDYLTKPFSPEELLVRINNLIKQRKKLAEKFRERTLVSATPSVEISLEDKFLNKARATVEANLSDYTFSVEKMAEEMNLSRTQLLRKLKALTGLSPNDFIKDLRLKRAADMIRQKADTITQVGYAVGFNDQSYFTKCFKKQFGVTPTEFSAMTVEK